MDSSIAGAQPAGVPPSPPDRVATEAEPGETDPRLAAIPDSHGHAKGEHKPYAEERPIPYTARMLFLWFFHACRRGSPRFMMVADHMNYLTFEDPAAVNLVRRALKLAQAGDLYGAAETAGVEVGHAQAVFEGLRRGMRYSIGAEVDNDPRSRPDAQNIVDAMRPDGMIRSVHFLPITHPTHGENWMWAFDNPEFKDLYDVVGTEAVWEIYMATLLEAIEKLPGHIVGHFYVPAIFGHWPADDVLEGYEDRLVEACAERAMAIELNSRYVYKHYLHDEAQLEKFRAAHLRLMRKAVEKGVAIAVGSDAHSPKDQGRGFAAVLALLDEAEINEIAFPIGGRLARVALRATEELLKSHQPDPEPAPRAEPETLTSAEPEARSEAAPEAAAETAVKAKKPRPSRAKTPAPPAVVAAPEPGPQPDVAAVVEPLVDVVADVVKEVVKTPAPPKPAPAKAEAKRSKTKPESKPAVKIKHATGAKKAVATKKASAPAKKAAAKKTAGKKKSAPVKAAPKKKTTPKKTVAKKPVAKKPVAKKAAPAKKSAAKKSAVKKSAPKKAAKKSVAKTAKRSAQKKSPVKKSAKRARR